MRESVLFLVPLSQCRHPKDGLLMQQSWRSVWIKDWVLFVTSSLPTLCFNTLDLFLIYS